MIGVLSFTDSWWALWDEFACDPSAWRPVLTPQEKMHFRQQFIVCGCTFDFLWFSPENCLGGIDCNLWRRVIFTKTAARIADCPVPFDEHNITHLNCMLFSFWASQVLYALRRCVGQSEIVTWPCESLAAKFHFFTPFICNLFFHY